MLFMFPVSHLCNIMYCYALQSRCAEQFRYLDTYIYIYIFIYLFFAAWGVVCDFARLVLVFTLISFLCQCSFQCRFDSSVFVCLCSYNAASHIYEQIQKPIPRRTSITFADAMLGSLSDGGERLSQEISPWRRFWHGFW